MSALFTGEGVGALLTFADLLALACCLGALSCRLWIVPENGSMQEVSDIFRRSAALVGGCLLVLAVTSLGLLWWRASTLSGTPPFRSLAVLPSVLTQTHVGHAWAVRAVAIAALTSLWVAARRNPTRTILWWSMLAPAALLAFSRSASGHAADAGDLTIGEWADWAHLMATSVWVGSVLVVPAIVFPPLTRATQVAPGFVAQFARRFSKSSGLALGAVLAAGTYGASLRLGSWSALFETEYGRTLALKLLLVGVAISLGAVNRFHHVRRIDRWAQEADAQSHASGDSAASAASSALRLTGQRLANQFSTTLRLEGSVLAMVLVAATELLQQVPPGMAMSMASNGPQEQAFSFGRRASAEQATRVIEIRATDAMRFQPAAITVKPGETVRFDVMNAGAIRHEFVLGDEKEQREHEQEMREMEKPRGAGMQDDANGISLAPGETKFITWTFPKEPGDVLFACHEPGHYEAGMVGVITIAP
jgi:uncharacterized cupredoxin-like copper-binding protein/uncharacterized membrane protein